MSVCVFSYYTCLVYFMMVSCSVANEDGVVIEVIQSDSSIHTSGYCQGDSKYHRMCLTLDQLNILIKNESNLLINSTKIDVVLVNCTPCALGMLIMFEKINRLSIYGSGADSTIQCELTDEQDTGLAFKNVSNLFIANLTFVGCKGLHNSTTKNTSSNDANVLMFKSAVYFEYCINVTMSKVTVRNTSGIGLVFYDTIGMIEIGYCKFESNFVPTHQEKDISGGGGVYIEFTPCFPGTYSDVSQDCHQYKDYKTGGHYTVQGCNFTDNKAHSPRSYFRRAGFRTFGQGGGLLISLRGNASGNHFKIQDSFFVRNSALWGGGLHLLLMDSIKENTISVLGNHFENNEACDGGGALAIYVSSRKKRGEALLSNNFVEFESCNFSNNQAKQGGGMIVFLSLEYDAANRLVFSNTSWITNSAKSGAAVDVTAKDSSSTVQGPFPTFINCKFYKNTISIKKHLLGGQAVQSHIGKASFLVTLSKVLFKGSVEFYGNNATGLHVSAGVASFSESMVAHFVENYGVRGGAIALIASSYLEIRRNSYFNFTSNHAFVQGGAIYSYSIGEHELHDHIFSLGCFMQYKNEHQCINCTNKQGRNITLAFKNNDVIDSSDELNHGRSIFSVSLLACASECHGDYSVLNASTALSCIANFTFIHSSAESQVSMAGSKFYVTDTIPTKVIPGKKFTLHIALVDALNNTLDTILRSYVKPKENSKLAIDSADSYIADNTLIIYGRPGAEGRVHLEKVGYHNVDLSFDIQVIQCPPGYILSSPNTPQVRDQCVCAWSTRVSYYGFLKCNHTHFQAYSTYGIWAGYSGENESEDSLFTADCPHNFCSYSQSKEHSNFYLLPGEPNRTELSNHICSKNRTGWLCSSCVDGYSAYFHSPNYKCGNDKMCNIGPLLYIISEIVPLTLFFTAIMFFRINFTSGKLTGFIFFAQVIDTLLLSISSLTDRSTFSSQWLLKINNWVLLLIYRIFNLNFFAVNSLSFCLWKSATTLDVIAFKYITIVFSFVLVIATYMLMNFCSIYRCEKHKLCRHFTVQSSIIHGISTFLVMCFAQCVQVSFLLLTPGRIYGKGGKLIESRLLYHGDISMYSIQHALYATPAFICIAVLVVPPTILLLWYPSGLRLFSLLGLEDSMLLKCLNRTFPLYKLKPLFDSFQSCFKDNFRFFSGLYFSYRILLITAYIFSIGLTQFFTLVEVLLVIMLLLHALAQPYKQRSHNLTDALLFFNLTIINALSLFIYIKSPYQRNRNLIIALIHIQTFLISLPLLVILLLITFHVIKRLRIMYFCQRIWKSRSTSVDEYMLNDEFPPRLVDSDDSDGSINYSLLKESAAI